MVWSQCWTLRLVQSCKVCVWFKSGQQIASQGSETYKPLKKVTLTISKSKAGKKAAQHEHMLNCTGNSLSRERLALKAKTREKPIGMMRKGKLTQARVYYGREDIRLNWLRFPLCLEFYMSFSFQSPTTQWGQQGLSCPRPQRATEMTWPRPGLP